MVYSVALPLQYPLQMVCLGLGHPHLLSEQELGPGILNEQPKGAKVNNLHVSQKGYSVRHKCTCAMVYKAHVTVF